MSKSIEQITPPTDTDVLNALKDNIFNGINCVQIGVIKTFYPATQSADVQIVLKKVLEVEADGTRILQDRPLILTCPVFTLFGGDSFVSMPVAEGDNCILLFNDREIDQWFANGGFQAPIGTRAHDLSDCIALVGIRSLQDSITDYLANGIRISFSDNSRISMTNDQIESIAALFKHNGNMEITGDLLVDGDGHIKGDAQIDGNMHVDGGLEVDGLVTGNGGGTFTLGADMNLNGHNLSGGVVNSSNGVSGIFTHSITVVNGIVTAGS